MTKTDLEKMVQQLMHQNTELTHMVTLQQHLLRTKDAELTELNRAKADEVSFLETDDDPFELDADEEEEPETPEQQRERKREEILSAIVQVGNKVYPHLPKFTEVVESLEIDNLSLLSEGMFIYLLRSRFSNEAAEAYLGKHMSPDIQRDVIRYLDKLKDDDALPLSGADYAEGRKEDKKLRWAKEKEVVKRITATQEPFSLPGRRELETFLNEQVVNIAAHYEDYYMMGITFPRSFILAGPPGCGKTYAVEQLAKHLCWDTYHLTASTIGSTYVHGSSLKISEIFDEAAKNAPALIIIDEMEAFLPDRMHAGEDYTHHSVEEVDCFLQLLQTAAEKKILVVGMTNYLEHIDPAVRRTGRMGTHITVGMPSVDEVNIVLRTAVEKRPHADALDFDSLSERLLNRPLSDVSYVAEESAMTAVRAGHAQIEQSDLETALTRLFRSTSAAPQRRALGFLG